MNANVNGMPEMPNDMMKCLKCFTQTLLVLMHQMFKFSEMVFCTY